MESLIVIGWWMLLRTFASIQFMIALALFFSLQMSVITICGLIYTLGCAFRSFYPRVDIERICIVDKPASYIFYGRTVATIAEISLGIQLSSVFSLMGEKLDVEIISFVAPIITYISIISNLFCWMSVISKNNKYHIYEESGWTIIGVVCLIFLILLYERTEQLHFVAMSLVSIGYILFMLYVDIPLYIKKYARDTKRKVKYLGFIEGLKDTMSCIKDRSYETWKSEIPWMTGYFTCAVWVSVYTMTVK